MVNGKEACTQLGPPENYVKVDVDPVQDLGYFHLPQFLLVLFFPSICNLYGWNCEFSGQWVLTEIPPAFSRATDRLKIRECFKEQELYVSCIIPAEEM